MFAGTSYEFPDYAKENLEKYLLDGARHMIAGNGIDYLASGRSYTRPGALNTDCIIVGAKELLKNSNFSVSEIAESLGYTSLAYFSAAFKKATGLSPTEYSIL